MRVEFEVLFQSTSGDQPSAVDNVESARPLAKDLIRCARWLGTRGVETHRTDFSIVGSCERSVFESLFSTYLVCCKGEGTAQPVICNTPPVVPEALRDCVASIEILSRPIFFP